MATMLATSKGAPIEIGRELGAGREGSVHELPTLVAQVAKLYDAAHQPDAEKQAKLAYMTGIADAQLLKYVAWPLETLHASDSGAVVGFLMPKISGKQPIHRVYSPAFRRLERPRASWKFLLHVARNTAAVFETVHVRGHVLGDVNHGNVLVGADTRVVLIDSDSFQIAANGARYRCESSVPHWVPPELQGTDSLRDVVRTPNHDNFGLALLIFHLLFGGRHPYAGVALKGRAGNSLESDIATYRYAYARDAKSRGEDVPPLSIPITLVPEPLEAMFHQAFTERGVESGRPTARQWVAALDEVRTHLAQCGASPMHVYPNHLTKCPWCALDQQGVSYFPDLGSAHARTASNFDPAQAWTAIEAVAPPAPITLPDVTHIRTHPTPLPPGIHGKGTITTFRVLFITLACGFFFVFPELLWASLTAGFIGWHFIGSIGSKDRDAERRNRQAAKDAARHVYDSLADQTVRETGPEAFRTRLEEFARLRDEYRNPAQIEKREREELRKTAFERQLHRFLDASFIETDAICGINGGNKAMLRSFGIETAADVDRFRLLQVPGFRNTQANEMMEWRTSLEQRFIYDPHLAPTEADRRTLQARIAARQSAIEAMLRAAPAELQRLRQMAESRRSVLEPRLTESAMVLARKTKDLALL